MTLVLPSELKKTLSKMAKQRHVTPQNLVEEAVAWYLRMDPDLVDELAAWQEIHDEAWQMVEESSK